MQHKKWLSIMTNEFISSEESENETMLVHSLPDYVNRMFKGIDNHCVQKKSPQAKRQMKPRVVGSISTRSRPGGDVPAWALRK